ncbi:hypothetical protein HPB48_026161 [Haemaphysalis longicornis]|uniref:Transposable element Tcb2 transposase n=1 Tax=Haemaphysalis longicornis TaxID=44386 RepID=A0A9J6HBE9_HAELO|nr:hypothetical protein HPB48_026161 [Haemaphysalis longicornis]
MTVLAGIIGFLPPSRRYDDKYVWKVHSSGRTAVTVWGAISYQGLGPLHRVTRRMTAAAYADIFPTVFVSYVLDGPFPGGLYHFQQDGAPVHTALGITNLQWPARSPDFNITENMWELMKTNLSKQPGLSTSESDELEGEGERRRTDPSSVDALCYSRPGRIQSVKLARGAQRRY